MAAVSIYSLEGLAGLGGRILFGVLADRLGVKRVLIAGLFAQAVVIAAYTFVRELGEFYGLAIVFGTIYGGVMPLYAVLAREYFGQAIMGTVFGAATMLSSIGMSIGPLAGGLGVRHVRRLRVDIHRLERRRPRRRRHRNRIPVVAAASSSGGSRLIATTHPLRADANCLSRCDGISARCRPSC